MYVRPLSGFFYWIEDGGLRMTRAVPAKVKAWRYEDVTASEEAYEAFLTEAQAIGLSVESASAMRSEVGIPCPPADSIKL